MDDMPLVSVIIPTFERASLVVRAIRSAQKQTYKNLDIIVVDDASSDNTKEVVTGIDDARVRYIRHESNRGGSAARNTGIRLAVGRYLAFLDDDDEWEPEKTAEQLKLLSSFDAVLCTSDERWIDLADHQEQNVIDVNELKEGKFTAGGTGVFMARAEVLKETLFDETLPRYQDWDLFIRVGQKWTIGYLNKRLVRYNEGTHSRISNRIVNMPVDQLEKEFRMLHKHREFLGERLYKWHMCRALMYGIRYRPNKVRHVAYVVTRYGLVNVMRALMRRVRHRLRERDELGLTVV